MRGGEDSPVDILGNKPRSLQPNRQRIYELFKVNVAFHYAVERGKDMHKREGGWRGALPSHTTKLCMFVCIHNSEHILS